MILSDYGTTIVLIDVGAELDMRMVTVDEVREGDRIGMNVQAADGRLVLRKGMIITTRLIEGLKRLQINNVYIEDEQFKDVQIEDSFSMRFRMQAVSVLNSVYDEVMQHGTFNSKALLDCNDEMVKHLVMEQDPLVHIKNIRTKAGYLLDHSVNVSMLSVLTAKALDYNHQQLRVIGLGAMLHDIGYVVKGLRRPDREHPKAGFDLIRKHQEIPLMAAHMVLQHHEQLNGLGFPYGVSGKEVREMAQICAVANDFDHHVNEIEKSRLPHEGFEYIMSKVETCYDIHIVRAFMHNVVPYPLGTHVQLTNGIIGVVTEINKTNSSRPVIKDLNTGLIFALNDHHTVFIKEVLSSRDICFS
jgi:HD-GYP domain-containing protein (c-di-GMP phosphodiesterase class II)